MTFIKAIQTRYKNHHFRSRLEARWAVFFDHMGLKWDYEPEGFELPSGRYLPDFYLHRETDEFSQFLEIKPVTLPLHERIAATKKLFELCEMTQKEAVLVMGTPQDNHDPDPYFSPVHLTKISKTGFIYRHALNGVRCRMRPVPPEAKLCALPAGLNVAAIDWTDKNKSTDDAVRAAMSARFEFGA